MPGVQLLSLKDSCTYYLLTRGKTLLTFGPKGLRISFKYELCPHCSSIIIKVLINFTSRRQKKISVHLACGTLPKIQEKIDRYLSLIIDQYFFCMQSN